ncbi:MAG: translation initiation factor IF-5A [Candidatus ainarchaeum sp.]|nr:translation initiation factor IF-5A [Candidatus ainarchaeum sp.]
MADDEKKFDQAGSLKPGKYVLIDGEVCQVKSVEKSKPGKHGAAKVRVVAFNIFTNQKRGLLKGTDNEIEVPVITKSNGQVVAVSGNVVQIMNMETFEIYDAPKAEDVPNLQSGDEVEYQKYGDNIKINRKKA